MNPAPFQAPPSGRLSRGRSGPRLRKLARAALHTVWAVLALTVLACAPMIEDAVNHFVLAVFR